MQLKYIGIGVVALIVMVLGYQKWISIPDRYIDDAKTLSQLLDQHGKTIKILDEAQTTLQTTKEWSFYAPYAAKEKWVDNMGEAKAKMATLRTSYAKEIQPILERDHEDDTKALEAFVLKGRVALKLALKQAKHPSERGEFLMKAYKNKENYYTQANTWQADIDDRVSRLLTRADMMIKKFPLKTKDITLKKVGGTQAQSNAKKTLSQLISEYQSHETDFSRYAAAYIEMKAHQKSVEKYTHANAVLLGQLQKSYVKVLVDQKIDHYIKVGRASWCEGDYCGSGDSYYYAPRKVDANTFEYFDNSNIETIAEDAWRGFSVKIDPARWKAIGIDRKKGMNSSHGYSEYWVESAFSKAYHKYSIIENGKVSKTDWVEISEDEYWAQNDNFGMAIVTKPLGFYESETNRVAEPAGLAMVAPPTMVNGQATGSNQYGQWQTQNGNSFFHYYGMYSMLGDVMGGGRYSYDDWGSYDRRKRNSSYYGRHQEYGTYGSKTAKSKTLRNSSYVKRNPSTFSRTGKTARTKNSVRGAGAANRGKGPSGSGK
jgi:hypothetical protein